MRKNQHPGKCNTCGTHVASGAGELLQINGRWAVRCAAHAGGGAAAVAATAAVALIIRLWVAAGRVFCAPVSRLDGKFQTYLSATRAAGFTFNGREQHGSVDQAHTLIAALRAAGFTPDVSPELLATLQARRARAQGEVVAANTRAAEIDAMLRQTGKALFPFQSTGINWLAPRTKALLGDDMGLGKTIQALCSAPVGAPIVVVCPSVAKGVWVRECKRFRPDLNPIALDGHGSFRWAQPGEMIVINYQILSGEKPAKKGYPAILPAHLAVAPKGTVLIADEAHALKASDSLRTSQFRALRQAALAADGRVWLLTATPLLNKAPELWAVLQAMAAGNEVFGSYDNFKSLWNAEDGTYGTEWGTPTAEVATRMQSIMLRRMKREVLPELPIKTIRDIEVNGLSATTKKLCDAALAQLESLGVNAVTACALAESTQNKSLAFEQISKARAALATAKLAAAIELVESFEDAGEPVVVFSAHVAPLKVLGEREGWAALTGETSATEKTQIAEDFQAGKLKGIACSIKAGGVAITLTKACNEIFIDEEWTPGLNEQAQDRCLRIGQTRGVVVTRLVAAHALDRRIAELLATKTEIIDGAVNAARRGAVEAVTPAIPTVDVEAIVADAKRAQDARDALAAATAPLAAMLNPADEDVAVEVSEECPF